MKRPNCLLRRSFCAFAPVFLTVWVLFPAPAQQSQNSGGGIVDDWSHHHVIFSNPGTLQDAMMNGRRQEWERIVRDPRYRMQQIRRQTLWTGQTATPDLRFPREGEPVFPVFKKRPLHGDWAVTIAGGSNNSVAADMYSAKYTFAPIATPSCANDFVVFPVNAAGASNAANLVGVNNLYKTTCTGTVPATLFFYNVGSGTIQTSPVLSEDGTKVAFVESVTNGSKFHVLKMDKSGNGGCPSSPCNGTGFNSPATPGTNNAAVNTTITMSGSVSVTRSSPFVDYQNDIAYVGDDKGKLHKFTGVFQGTPTEVTTAPWPFTVANGVILTGPVFDSGTSQHIFVGGSNSKLYCVTSAGAACSTASITVGTGAILDAPIVDSTNQTVFAEANNASNAILTQATTALGSQVNVTMGINGTDLYNGAFDNAYFTSVSTGHLYFCGNLTSAATPVLYRVTFNSSGTMSSAHDSNSFQLVLSGNSGTTVDCTPSTEIFNGTTDFLFLGVFNHGFTTGTTNCSNQTCIMSFDITSAFPSAAHATATSGTLNLGTNGMSGFIIDNVSGTTGASQIYFGNLQQGTGVQASQSALQ